MANYRYLLTNILTGARLAELPFESASFSHVLNAPGSFSGMMALRQPTELETVLSTQLQLGKVGMYVERDGVIVWGGIPWTTQADVEQNTFAISGEGFHSYFRRRVLRATKTYAATEQVNIAKDLLDSAQGITGGSIGVVTSDVQATGKLRDRSYLAFERKLIGELIEQLAAVIDGFDFRYESRWNAGVVQTRFLTSYPPTGRLTDFVFDLGTQVTDLKISENATALCTHVDAIGTGEGDAMLIATVANAQLINTIPLLDAIENHTDVTQLSTLSEHANKRLLRGSAPIVIPGVSVDPALDPRLGSYLVGDRVTVRGGIGLAQIDGLFRITEQSVTVDENGGESSQLTFAGSEVF